jgi:beta-glucosidase
MHRIGKGQELPGFKSGAKSLILQLLKRPEQPMTRRLALRGFQRVHLEPGASQKVEFQLNPRDLSMVTDLGDIIVPQGKYTVSIGGGQPGTGVPSITGNLDIKGQIMLPE